MSDEKEMTANEQVSLDDLAYYMVLGVDKQGKNVTVQSASANVSDVAAMLARAQVSLQLTINKLALEVYRREREASQSPIIKPGL